MWLDQIWNYFKSIQFFRSVINGFHSISTEYLLIMGLLNVMVQQKAIEFVPLFMHALSHHIHPSIFMVLLLSPLCCSCYPRLRCLPVRKYWILMLGNDVKRSKNRTSYNRVHGRYGFCHCQELPQSVTYASAVGRRATLTIMWRKVINSKEFLKLSS